MFDNFLVVDANNDDRTWTGEDDSFKYTYSGSNEADDWFISPAIEVADASVLYDIAINVKCYSSSYPEDVEVFIGRQQSVEAMTIPVIEKTNVSSTEWIRLENTLELPEAGRYYIGVHCVSDKTNITSMSTVWK